jgi:hypothetical protein
MIKPLHFLSFSRFSQIPYGFEVNRVKRFDPSQ